jgi:hypothetical protein
MKKDPKGKGDHLIKIIFVLIICTVLSFPNLMADVPTSYGIQVFAGYDIYSTSLVKEDTIWKQWFAGWMTPSDMPWDRIYYSFSTDSGSTWAAPQLAFTIANVQVNDPAVLRLWDPLNQRWYYLMYYTYYPSGYGDPTNYISASVSLDGIIWEHQGVLIGADNGLDMDGAWSPSAYATDSLGTAVFLYFHNNHPDGRIFRTTLGNGGLSFDKSTTVAVTASGKLRANPEVSRSVDGRWWLFYNGPSLTTDNQGSFNTCKMVSEDGINWQESGLNPVQEFDTMTTCTPFVNWTSDSTYQLWYGYGSPSFLDFSVYRQDYACREEPVSMVVASSEALEVMKAGNLIDDDPSTFWSSIGYAGSASHSEWISLNLGEVKDIARVVLTPRVVSGVAMCFPVNFRFQGSTDGVHWTDIDGQTYTNYVCDTLEQTFAFSSSVSVQYIRFITSKLSADSYGNYYCQIAEMDVSDLLTSVQDIALPPECNLLQNYPNPFHDATTICYTLSKPTCVRLIVYDVLGKNIATLVNEIQSKGSYTVKWQGESDQGARVTGGYYLYRLTVEGRSYCRKMLFVK